MSEKPWLTDPLYGGMSEEAARRSYEAWVKQGSKPLPSHGPALTEPDHKFAIRQRRIEALLAEYQQDLAAYAAWMENWLKSRPRGFRAKRRQS